VWERCILLPSSIGHRDVVVPPPPRQDSTSEPHLALLALVRKLDVPSQLLMPRANPCGWLSGLFIEGTGPCSRRKTPTANIGVNCRAQHLFIQSDGAIPTLPSSLSHAVAAAIPSQYSLLLLPYADCALPQVALKQPERKHRNK
jgi:hypothetical protein